jgi:hypothetical protein
MNALTCAEARQLAGDLAVGDLAGPERDRLLTHCAGCAECRQLAAELAELADRLLLLAPEDEPPSGFETRVVARVRAESAISPARRRHRWIVAAAAAAVLAMGGGAVAGRLATRHADNATLALNHEYVAALRALGGRSLRAAPLMDNRGSHVGQVFMYDGSPSWIFVSVDHGGVDGDYMVEVSGPHAGPVAFPGMRIVDGHGALGGTALGDVRALVKVAVLDASGHERYRATVDRGS